MISFTQLCEYLTDNQRYSWFYWPNKYITYLTPDEVLLVKIERISDKELCRVWYPRSKWVNRPMDNEAFKIAMMRAIDSEDWDEVKRLKERNKR